MAMLLACTSIKVFKFVSSIGRSGATRLMPFISKPEECNTLFTEAVSVLKQPIQLTDKKSVNKNLAIANNKVF